MARYSLVILSISSSGEPSCLTISNDERSWEHYYSKIVQVDSDGTVLDDTAVWCHEVPTETVVKVSSATGHLAPRGGSSNLCDPGKPYSDTAQIQLRAVDGCVLASNHCYLLVVGTEAETWPHWIHIT